MTWQISLLSQQHYSVLAMPRKNHNLVFQQKKRLLSDRLLQPCPFLTIACKLTFQPDLMNVRINCTPNKTKTRGIDTKKWTLACICYRVGLGLWGRCISYVRKNCVSYARQQISYHMHTKIAYYMHAKHARVIYTPKSIFSYQYHEFSFLFWRAIYTHFHETRLHIQICLYPINNQCI